MRHNALAAILFAGAALAAVPALAEPFESNPNLAATDADFAAGKQAMEKKNWPEAAKRFEVSHPDLTGVIGRVVDALSTMGI